MHSYASQFFSCTPDAGGVQTSALWISSLTLYHLPNHPATHTHVQVQVQSTGVMIAINADMESQNFATGSGNTAATCNYLALT